MKYKVKVGTFAEYFRSRKYIISANSEEEAYKIASLRFEKDLYKTVTCENVSSIELDEIELL